MNLNYMNTLLSGPRLIEPGVRYFLNGTLKECRKFKDNNATIFFNIYMTGLLILVIGGFLWYKYKGKLTPAEHEVKNRKKKEYIISKLHQMAYIRKTQGNANGLITSLPQW
jgi:hypothetical protein